jgi:hypothetical protein
MGVSTIFHTNTIDIFEDDDDDIESKISNTALKAIDVELSYEDSQIFLPKNCRGTDNEDWFNILVKLHEYLTEQKVQIYYNYLHWTFASGDAIAGTILFNTTSVIMIEINMDGTQSTKKYERPIDRNT